MRQKRILIWVKKWEKRGIANSLRSRVRRLILPQTTPQTMRLWRKRVQSTCFCRKRLENLSMWKDWKRWECLSRNRSNRANRQSTLSRLPMSACINSKTTSSSRRTRRGMSSNWQPHYISPAKTQTLRQSNSLLSCKSSMLTSCLPRKTSSLSFFSTRATWTSAFWTW